MKFVMETSKSIEQAEADLLAAVKRHHFGVLYVHNLRETMKQKGVDFGEECRIFEICNPQKAAEVLAEDMSLNMALPCRISVYTERGATKIGMIRPTLLLAALSGSDSLKSVAREVETLTVRMIEEAV
jgi:uncharacterized protein (DUF302 family)